MGNGLNLGILCLARQPRNCFPGAACTPSLLVGPGSGSSLRTRLCTLIGPYKRPLTPEGAQTKENHPNKLHLWWMMVFQGTRSCHGTGIGGGQTPIHLALTPARLQPWTLSSSNTCSPNLGGWCCGLNGKMNDRQTQSEDTMGSLFTVCSCCSTENPKAILPTQPSQVALPHLSVNPKTYGGRRATYSRGGELQSQGQVPEHTSTKTHMPDDLIWPP
jgi:hypothetical protein